jgi:hypothetical protein
MVSFVRSTLVGTVNEVLFHATPQAAQHERHRHGVWFTQIATPETRLRADSGGGLPLLRPLRSSDYNVAS